MASTAHLHAESQTLPIEPHLSLLCSQFLARALQPSHPSFPTVTAPSGPRSIRNTLQSRFIPSVSPLLTDGVMPPSNFKLALADLHTTAVQTSLNSAPPLIESSPPNPHPLTHLKPPSLAPTALSSPSSAPATAPLSCRTGRGSAWRTAPTAPPVNLPLTQPTTSSPVLPIPRP